MNHRTQCQEMQNEELDLVILAHIDAHGSSQSAPFYFSAKQICRTTFLFLHSISKHRYKNLVKNYASMDWLYGKMATKNDRLQTHCLKQ